jgi:hypothetical protein
MAMVISSCKDDETVDNEKPAITIEEPSANDTISVGTEEIHIEFLVNDNDKLHQLSVRLTTPPDSLLYSSSPNVEGLKSYSFHQHTQPTAVAVTSLTLTVTAVDATGNTQTQTIAFFMAP